MQGKIKEIKNLQTSLDQLAVEGGETQEPSATLDLGGHSMLEISLTSNLVITSVTNMAAGGSAVLFNHNGYTLTVLGVTGFTDYGNGEYHVRLINFSATLSGKVRVYDGVSPATSSYSDTALDVFARRTNMTTAEKVAFNALILSQSSAEGGNGNWELLDEFYDFSISNATDKLIGCKSKTATISGTVTSVSGGLSFGGGYVATDFIPSVDGVNWDYANDSCQASIHVMTNGLTTSTQLLGVATANNLSINQYTTPAVRYSMFTAVKTSGNITALADDTIYGLIRDNGIQIRLYIDDAWNETITTSVTGDITEEILIGDGNLAGAWDGVAASLRIGGSAGFDFASWYTAYNIYRTALGF